MRGISEVRLQRVLKCFNHQKTMMIPRIDILIMKQPPDQTRMMLSKIIIGEKE